LIIDPSAIASAQDSRRRWGVPADVSLAQFGVESAWGRLEPAGSNNPFGIQRLPGLPYVSANSFEYRNGARVAVVENFAKFASLEQAFEEHGKLIATNPAYRKAMAVKDDSQAFANALTGVYATAPNYGRALIAIMREFNLAQYEVPFVGGAPAPISPAFEPHFPPDGATKRWIQGRLNELGFASPELTVDGIIGIMTTKALEAFQSARRLNPDGAPGPLTLGALQKAA